MSSLALINEFLGQPPNASSHGYQIDHILEFCHWFMGALFIGWSAFFIFVLIRFRKRRQPGADHMGVRSGISTHLEFSVVTWWRSSLVSIITYPDRMGSLAGAMSVL